MKTIKTFVLILFSCIVYCQPGELDLSFGNQGKTITTFEDFSAEATSIALQTNGKIVVVGTGFGDSHDDLIAVRYSTDGIIDESFGTDGRFILSISDFRDRCFDVTTDEFDNIYLAGITFNQDFDSKGFVAKISNDGTIDSTFAENGIWINPDNETNDDIRSIIIHSDNKLLIAGKTRFQFESDNIILIKLNTDGTYDNNFGNNGQVKVIAPDGYNPKFAAIDNEGNIVTGGFQLSNSINVVLSKFDNDGNIDQTFGNNGIVIDNSQLDEFGRSLAIQNDNKILVGTGIANSSGRDFGLNRYEPNGDLDGTFGDNGKVSTDFQNTSNTAHSVIIQDDERIILSGFLGVTPNHDYAIARYDIDGSLDSTFGDNGKVITDFSLDDLIFTSIIDTDGKLLCAGNSKTNNDVSSFSIARYYTEMGTNTNDQLTNTNLINIHPNPSNGSFSIKFRRSNIKVIAIQILDIDGQIYQSINSEEVDQIKNEEIEIKLSNRIISGIYLVKIVTKNSSFCKQIVLQRWSDYH